MIIYLSLSPLTIIVTIRASKCLHMKFFIGEDVDFILGGSMFVKQGR